MVCTIHEGQVDNLRSVGEPDGYGASGESDKGSSLGQDVAGKEDRQVGVEKKPVGRVIRHESRIERLLAQVDGGMADDKEDKSVDCVHADGA